MALVLRLNDRGPLVADLQKALNIKAKAGLTADGHFGAKTDTAVRAYQRSLGLVVDGIAGPKTLTPLGMTESTIIRPKLTTADYIAAAKELGCGPWMIHALALKETRGDAFLPDGRTRILYERHWFYKLMADKALRDRLAVSERDICNSAMKSSKNTDPKDRYVGGAAEYGFLDRARKYDDTAALSAASYGQFQVMGFNAVRIGYDSVQEFERLMQQDVFQHLMALVRFIKATPAALKGIRSENLQMLAEAYNGAAYAKNNYDKDLAKYIAQVRSQYA